MIYRVYQPRSSRVRQWVDLIWYIAQDQGEATAVMPRMIPDGHYHLVINLGDTHSYINSDGCLIQPRRSHINANQTDYVHIVRTGRVEIIGVLFRPYGLAALVREPIHELTGSIWNMDELLGPVIAEMEERLFWAQGISTKLHLLEEILANLFEPASELRPEIKAAAAFLIRNHGLLPIRQVAKQVQLSERTLERVFKATIGMTPKQFADIQRMQFVLRLIKQPNERMLDYALQAGFYDQAHFTRRFKHMVGTTPGDYLQNKNLLSDLYNTSISSHVIL